MGKLTTASASKNENTAPKTPGAVSNSGGATTESMPLSGPNDKKPPEENKGKKPPEDKIKKVVPEVKVSYYLEQALEGNYKIPVRHPVFKGKKFTGEYVMKQIVVVDKYFEQNKAMKENQKYADLFEKELLKIGFEKRGEILNQQELREAKKAELEAEKAKKSGDPFFGCFHPEYLGDKERRTLAFYFPKSTRFNRGVAAHRQFIMEGGKLYTKNREVFEIWLQNGFVDMGDISPHGKKESVEKKPGKSDS